MDGSFSTALDSLASWVGRTSLEASILIGLVWLTQTILRRWLSPSWRYALWLLVVFRLVLLELPVSPFSLGHLLPDHAQTGHAPATRPPEPKPAPQTQLQPNSKTSAWPVETSPDIDPPAENVYGVIRIAMARSWLSGVLILFIIAGIRNIRFNRKLAMFPLAKHQPWLRLLDQCQRDLRMRCRLPVRLVARGHSPATCGLFRPTLLLPQDAPELLNETELRLVFYHELIHVRRRHVLMNALLSALQAMHWFNPLVWYSFRELRLARELHCDEAVLRRRPDTERITYARLLVKWAEHICLSKNSPHLLSMMNRPKHLNQRIRMMTTPRPTFRLSAALGSIIVVVLGAMTLTQADDNKPIETPPASAALDQANAQEVRDAHRQGLQILRDEKVRIEAQINEHNEILNKYRKDLALYNVDADDPFTSRKTHEALLAARLEAQTSKHNLEATYHLLSELEFADRVQTIPTAFPDELLNKLLERKAQIEIQLVELANSYGPTHPEVAGPKKALQEVERQIRERVAGIMLGLKTKLNVLDSNMQSLDEEMNEYLTQTVARAIQRRPYLEHKQQLENLQMVRDRISLRIAEEEMEAAFKRATP